MSDAQDSRKRRRIDQTNKPDKPDKPELNVEWTNLQRVWLKRVQRLFEDFGPPQPSLELKRREEVMELRRRLSDEYAELIETWKISLRSNSESSSTDSPTLSSLPREAFNRWLMERINAGGTDPLLGGQADASLLKAAAKGLEHDLCRPLHSEGAPKDFESFAEKVRSLCLWLASEADAAAERIARSVESARSASQTSKVSATLNAKRGCYVFSLDQSYSNKLGEQAVVEAESESNESDANSSSFTLSPSALARLAKLMRRATRWAEKISRSHVAGEAWAGKFHAFMQQDASFWDITFCLLCRYDALCGPGHKEGGGFHAAIPSVAFDVLEKMDDVNDVPVRVECFASPQLCHAEKWHFCSAFRDVDIFFGSLGPFLDEEMDIGRFGGIYEVNPPFVRGVVLQLARKLLRALELAESEDRSLCIFLVLPGLASHKLFSDISEPNEKLEDELDALDRLLRCRFRRALHASSRRAYTNGLAFKTERSWPLFAVPTTLVLLSSQPSEHEVADFERLCTSWGHSEQDITDDIMRERCEKRV